MIQGRTRVGIVPTRSALALLLALATIARTAYAVEDGAAIYDRCRACHTIEANGTGPRHCGLFGRMAGTEPGFAYSPAMRVSRIRWNKQTLDQFLAAPTKLVPGTLMTYAGVPDAAERKRLIVYLESASKKPTSCR